MSERYVDADGTVCTCKPSNVPEQSDDCGAVGDHPRPPAEGPEKWVPEAIAEQEAYLASLERCEAHVLLGTIERECNRPLGKDGQCDRAHAHIE